MGDHNKTTTFPQVSKPVSANNKDPKITEEKKPQTCEIKALLVRIFTYLIGREAAFADNLKWMACANKGFFTQISTLADVQENVMEYLHVLSRPKVIDQEHDVVWTEAYIDST
ncbi:hypothetical protein STEG23_019618, partial [Scotinomys teguina]